MKELRIKKSFNHHGTWWNQIVKCLIRASDGSWDIVIDEGALDEEEDEENAESNKREN